VSHMASIGGTLGQGIVGHVASTGKSSGQEIAGQVASTMSNFNAGDNVWHGFHRSVFR
jgi:hypothetical protein